MAKTIAVAGKGGTGKTTITALLVRYLRDRGLGNILSIDADPSSNLNLALGLPLDETIGDIREEMLGEIKTGEFPSGMSKQDYLDYRIQSALVESPKVDLLAMGRPEGPHCYCAANNILRLCIDRMSGDYSYVVIDNEAGLEHISRRTTRDIDMLLIVSDPTIRGLTTAARVVDLVDELKTRIGETYLIVNRVVPGQVVQGNDGKIELTSELQGFIERGHLSLLAAIPADPMIAEFDGQGKPLVDLPPDSVAWQALQETFGRVLTHLG